MPENAVIFLGTSGGNPQPDCATSGYLLKLGSDLTLIDCGGGVTSSFLRSRLDPFDLRRVVISHTHSDHVCELSLMIQLMHVRGRTSQLDLFLPQEFVSPFRDYLKAVYLFEDRLPFNLVINGYESGRIYKDSFKLEAIQNSHLAKHQEVIPEIGASNRMQSHSFKFTIGEQKLFYSGDVASLDEIKPHLNACDVAIIESMHCDSSELLDIADKNKGCRYILTHFGDSVSRQQMQERLTATSIENVIIAQDGMVLEL